LIHAVLSGISIWQIFLCKFDEVYHKKYVSTFVAKPACQINYYTDHQDEPKTTTAECRATNVKATTTEQQQEDEHNEEQIHVTNLSKLH
jgi:hypothetical protein